MEYQGMRCGNYETEIIDHLLVIVVVEVVVVVVIIIIVVVIVVAVVTFTGFHWQY